MYTVDRDIENTLIIKNSKFITYLFYVSDKKEISNLIDKIRYEHRDANHVCFAYKTCSDVKFSDDGEPKGTAGLPLLSIIEKNYLVNVLVVVVRYFGGVKLGAGGLIRAYGNSFKEALLLCNKVELIDIDKYEITFTYDLQQNIEYILKNSEIISKVFTDYVTYIVLVDDDILLQLKTMNVDMKLLETIKKRVINS